jgi:hypothetical protein
MNTKLMLILMWVTVIGMTLCMVGLMGMLSMVQDVLLPIRIGIIAFALCLLVALYQQVLK